MRHLSSASPIPYEVLNPPTVTILSKLEQRRLRWEQGPKRALVPWERGLRDTKHLTVHHASRS